MASSHQPFVYADSEDSLPSEFICAVCHDVCGTHSACPGCNQTFCEVCVHRWFDVQRTTGANCTCPYCRRKLRFSDLKHDPSIQAQLEQLSVLCPNAPLGCAGVMCRAKLPGHLQHSCMFETVSCSFCGQPGLRSEVQAHERSSCRKRPVPCAHAEDGCRAMVPLQDMAQHTELNCAHACKPCPHCSTPVPRAAWLQHLQSGCPVQQPCSNRSFGCSFRGDSKALSAHARSCAFLRDRLASGAPQANSAAAAAASSEQVDEGEVPEGCMPDVQAAFKASTALSSSCQVRRCLLDTIPQAVLPPKLQQQQQQQQHLQPGALGPKQLATLTPPKVFAAPPPAAAAAAAAAGIAAGTAHSTGSTGDGAGGSSSSSSSQGQLSVVELLALGAPGCLAGVGLAPNPLLEAAWRIILNLAVVQVFKVQETAAEQELSAFMLYSSICRAWDTLQDFSSSLLSTTADGGSSEHQQAEHSQQEQQGQEQQPQQQSEPGAAAASSSTSTEWSPGTVLASVHALLAGGSTQRSASSTQPSGPPHQAQQQQQQQQLTGRQIWQRWLTGGSSSGGGAAHGSNGGSSGSDGGGSGSDGGFDDADDGMPGLQRGLYEDEYTGLEHCLLREEQGVALLAAVCAAVYPLCLWVSTGGPCFAAGPGEAEWLGQLASMASYRLGSLMTRLSATAFKLQLKASRKRQREQQRQQQQQQGQGHAGEAGSSSWRLLDPQFQERAAGEGGRQQGSGGGLAAGVRGLGASGVLPVRGASTGGSAGQVAHTPGAQQQQQEDQQQQQQQAEGREEASLALQFLSNTWKQPGAPFAAVQQQLLRMVAGPAVAENPYVPRYMFGLQPLVAAELSSALLLLHDVRADQCEVSLVPGSNTHCQHGFRGYWALSVLGGVAAWLGPGFRLSWQALAVVNDMLVLLVEVLCQVLGDSFYDCAAERVPMSPALALEAAQLVLPPGLLEGGLPHLLRLSATYRDVSCEDLSDVTWEQLARKLGLVAELDKLVGLVNELLPVTFMDEDEDEDDDDGEDYEGSSSDGMVDLDTEDSEEGSGSGSDTTTTSDDSYVTEDESAGDGDSDSSGVGSGGLVSEDFGGEEGSLYAVDDGGGSSSSSEDNETLMQRARQLRASRAAARQPQRGLAAAARGRSSGGRSGDRGGSDGGSEGGSDGGGSSSGEWESADDDEAAALLEAAALAHGASRAAAEAAAAEAAAGGADSPSAGTSSADAADSAEAQPAAGNTGSSSSQGHTGGAAAAAPAAGAARQASCSSWPIEGLLDSIVEYELQQRQEEAAGQHAPGAAAAAAAAADTAEAKADWRQQWADRLATLSQAAGAAAAADKQDAAPSSSSAARAAAAPEQQQQQQQQQVSLGPYTAQLLQQACEVAAKQPDQLMLQGALALEPDDPCAPATAATGNLLAAITAADSEGAAVAAVRGISAAETAAAGGARQRKYGDTSLFLRSITTPMDLDSLYGLDALDGGARGGRAATTSTAGGTSAAAQQAPGTAAGAAAAAGPAPGSGGGAAPGTAAATANGEGRQGGSRGAEQEPGDACTHGVVLLLGLLEVVLQRLLQAAARVAAADPELLRVPNNSSSSSSSASDRLQSQQPPAAAAAAATVAGSQGGGAASGGDGDMLQACVRGGGVLVPSCGPRVVISAKHVQLAVAGDEDLARLLLRSWAGEPVSNTVGWAGAVPSPDPALLPDAATEPLTAFLLAIAQATQQQQQGAGSSSGGGGSGGSGGSSGSSGSAFPPPCVFPVDLRQYCGVTVTAPPAAQPTEATPPAAGQQAQTLQPPAPAAAAAAAGEADALACEGPAATCCFMSGWQCSACAEATAQLAAAGLEAQLAACRTGLAQAALQAAAAKPEGQAAGEGIVPCLPLLSEEQLAQLLHATRLYHLQQPALDSSDDNSGSAGHTKDGSQHSSSSSSSSSSAQFLARALQGMRLQADPASSKPQHHHQRQHADPSAPQAGADRGLQLQPELQVLLQPLRDVAALREAHLQQQDPGPAMPPELFGQLVEDVMCEVLAERQTQQQREQQVREALRSIMGPAAAGAGAAPAAVAGAGESSGVGSGLQGASRAGFGSPSRVHGHARAASTQEPASPAAAAAPRGSSAAGVDPASAMGSDAPCELSMQPDALQLLQQAAEDFLVQQLAAGNRLALHAGRQELQPADLRLAMASSGYGHLLPTRGGAGRGGRGGGAAGLGGSKRRRLLGAPSLLP